MKLARVAVLGIALGAGVIAAVLAIRLTASPPAAVAPEQTAQIDATKVLVAAKDIRMGTTITPDDITWQEWPKNSARDNFLVESQKPTAMKDVEGAIARATFYSGEPITEDKLVRSSQGFMSAILPAGKRAVATKISADTSAGGFILPNDRVDVIMTRHTTDNAETATGFQTETILNNVRVLAIDQAIEEKDGKPVVVGQTATLELTPEQAQILTVAQQMSDRLTLALRSIADSHTTAADTSQDAYYLIGGGKNNGAVTVVRNGVAKEVTGLR
jgi:pilus assembly protein CpaB